MNLHNSPGIVLKRERHLEQDSRIVLFLKDFGKVMTSVKGAQRMTSKLRPLQEPFIEADYQLFLPDHRPHARLISGRLINSHHNIRHNTAAFETASKCCETIDILFPFRAPSPPVYDLLRKTLQSLQATPEASVEWTCFLWHFLKVMGHGDYLPTLLHLSNKTKETNGREAPHHLYIDEMGISISLSRENLNRCVAFFEDRLEWIMPRKLKSGILAKT
ncbi:MAG: DNA repair protein RecO [Elusimicrobia bacterium]|nr:DNA repair protein RecO [Candidatus Obscuribacterium magneticum]